MKFKKINNNYIIRLEMNEKIRETLTNFLKEHKINSGFFYGLGAVSEIELAYYTLKEKKYYSKNYEGEFEVLNISGNIALVDENPFIHAHITLGDEEYKTFGGHLVEGTASPTLEVYLTPFEENIKREFNEETGLKLLKFE